MSERRQTSKAGQAASKQGKDMQASKQERQAAGKQGVSGGK
jgi:hypothetical protein